MSKMESFYKCRSCYNHIGGVYAVNFFSYLMDNEYIRYIDSCDFSHSHHKLPLLVTSVGADYFRYFGEDKLNKYNSAFACLDGTEKKPHLGGKYGEIVLSFFIEKKLLFKNNKNRIFLITEEAKKILSGSIGEN